MCEDTPAPLRVIPRTKDEEELLRKQLKERLVRTLLQYDRELVNGTTRTKMLADILHTGWTFVAEKAEEGYDTIPRKE